MSINRIPKKRLFVSIILKKDGKVVESINLPSKTRILRSKQLKSGAEWNLGYIVVRYNRRMQYMNHAYFDSVDKLTRLLDEFLDPYLLEQFCS